MNTIGLMKGEDVLGHSEQFFDEAVYYKKQFI